MAEQRWRGAAREDWLEVADLVAALRLCADWLARDEEELAALDRAIGDGDHGRNMRIGFEAVREELQSGQLLDADLGTLMTLTGLTLLSAVGGASGPLYSAAFIEAGLVLEGCTSAGLRELAAALQAACRGVARRGHCYPGDKTLLDTLQPAADALNTARVAGLALAAGLEATREAAHQGMLSTIPMLARCGLAMRYGPRSIGHQDPGATSCNLILSAIVHTWRLGRR